MTDFQHFHAVREATQLLIALTGPSGCGKTLSALRLAAGIVSIVGGKIFVIDTNGGQSTEYAAAEGEQANPAEFRFDFECLELRPPHSSLRFRDAILYCASKGASVIIGDSFSEEHQGEGGYLDFGEEEEKRVGKSYGACWRAPKADRRRLRQSFAQSRANLILCFYGEEKLDWSDMADQGEQSERGSAKKKKREPRPLGWMPIAGKEFMREMNVSLVLEPGNDGTFVADRNSLTTDQREMFKVREYFKRALSKPRQIDEEMGRKMALWATGGRTLTLEDQQRRTDRAARAAVSAPQKPQVQIGPDHSEPCPVCKNNPPQCKVCKIELLWRRESLHSQWGLLEALWRCPNKCKSPTDKRKTTNVKAVDWHHILTKPPARDAERAAIAADGPEAA
jgi:hypothetical protein